MRHTLLSETKNSQQYSCNISSSTPLSSTLLLKTRIEHVKKGVKLQLQGKFHTLPSSSSSFGHGQSSQSIVHQRCTAELRIETTKVSCLREHCNDSVTLMTQLELQFVNAQLHYFLPCPVAILIFRRRAQLSSSLNPIYVVVVVLQDFQYISQVV